MGKFNEPEGQTDSWIYVYDAASLDEVARHPVPELVHGAGGIEYHEGRFIVVGGLPPGTNGNYLYEYSTDFSFIKRHILNSGYTYKEIQTAHFYDGNWWFGCYGRPRTLLKADMQFKLVQSSEFDASLGIIGVGRRFFSNWRKRLQR